MTARFKSCTRFQTSLAYTTTGFGAFGYVPGRTTTLCGQCEDEKTQEPRTCNFGASHHCLTESTKINGDDTRESTKALEESDKKNALSCERNKRPSDAKTVVVLNCPASAQQEANAVFVSLYTVQKALYV